MTLRSLLLAGAIGAVASTAAATGTFNVSHVTLKEPYLVHLSGRGLNRNVHASPLLFLTDRGSFPVFCVDPFHSIHFGAVDYRYVSAPLTTDSSGAVTGTGLPLTLAQIGELGGLANYGFGLMQHGDADLAEKLAGVQAAMWSLEGVTVTPYGADAADVAGYMLADMSWAPTHQDVLTALYDVRDNSQGVLPPGVPEPSTWALMLIGFGGLGAALRGSRGKRAVAV